LENGAGNRAIFFVRIFVRFSHAHRFTYPAQVIVSPGTMHLHYHHLKFNQGNQQNQP
jgi:hypothetical protein